MIGTTPADVMDDVDDEGGISEEAVALAGGQALVDSGDKKSEGVNGRSGARHTMA